MKIVELSIKSNKLKEQRDFYVNLLGCYVVSESENHLSIRMGDSILTFDQSNDDYLYHYCFMVPSDLFQQSVRWISERLEPMKIEGERVVEHSDVWNADSVYFYDGGGNIAEFIAHYDETSLKLNNNLSDDFNMQLVVSINEIGVVVDDLVPIHDHLSSMFNCHKWTGNLTRFLVMGGPEGRFIIVNGNVKKTWFPTNLRTNDAPFKMIINSEGETYSLTFENGKLNGQKVDK